MGGPYLAAGRGPHVRSRGAPCPAGRFGICRTARQSGKINAERRTDCGAHRMGLRQGWWGVLGDGGRVFAGLTGE
jgi:hypothetical protein